MRTRNLLILALCLVSVAFAQVDSLWERSADDGTLPAWFDTGHLTRGFAYGNVEGNDRLYVVSRNGGNFVFILDANTGADVDTLSTEGIGGGTYLLSDIGVTDDGVIFMCNLTTNTSTSGLKVYRWDSEADDPTMVIDWTHDSSFRLGDKMYANGSVADNTAHLWFAASNSDSVVIFNTTDNGATWEPTIYSTATNASFGGSAMMVPSGDGSMVWYNATGRNPEKSDTEGLMGTVPGSVVPTSSNAIEELAAIDGRDYVATYTYGTGNEKAIIFRASSLYPDWAVTYGVTQTLGANSNANGAGDVAVRHNDDGTATVYVLACNNGLGAYNVSLPTAAMEANNLTGNWWADVYDYDFFNNDNNTRGMGFNPVTDHLLVASRSGGTNVHIVDATTGEVLGTLDMTDVAGGTFAINKIVAADDGVIYVCNLAVGGTGFKVYRWADESAVPTVAFSGDLNGRAGDVMGIYGSGTETVLYVSGANSAEIAVLTTTDGETFTAGTPIAINAGEANGGICGVSDTTIAINAAWNSARHISITGATLDVIGDEIIPSYYGNVHYLGTGSSDFLIVNTNHQTEHYRKIQVYRIEDGGFSLFAEGEAGGAANGNPNVTGDAWTRINDDNTVTIFQMSSNNAIASWNMELPPTDAYISNYDLDFGTVAVNANAHLGFQIGNVGTTDLIITGMSVDDAVDFSFDFTAPDTLAPGDTIDVMVEFAPVMEGLSDGTLEINTNIGDYAVQLQGEGYVLWPLEWRLMADANDWIGQGDLVRGVAFNRTTGHILVPSRVGGSFVHILDGETGAILDSLDMTGVSGGTYHMNMLAVSDDGQIFLTNLAAWGGQIFRLYHWTDEQAAPTMIVDATYDDFGARLGDAVGVSGTGNDVRVFVSGSGADRIVVFEPAGADTFAHASDILLPVAGAARFGIAPVDEDGMYLLINGAGTSPYYIKDDGTVLHEFDTAVIPSGTSISYVGMDLLDGGTRHFAAILNGWATGTYGIELLGEPGDGLCDSLALADAPTDMYADFPNGNAAGQVTYNSWTHSLVELVTNNGLSSYSMFVIEDNPVLDAPADPVLSTTTIDFGDVALNAMATETFSIINEGEGDLIITDVAFETYDGAFVTDLEAGTMVAGNSTDTLMVTVQFIPFQEGATAANLVLSTNAGDLTVALSGTGYDLWPLNWRVLADDTPWFYQAGVFQDMVRSMAFNRATGHLLAVSRIGGSYIYILDAETGDSLGTVSTEGISGGTYHINQIAVTPDGQIFVCGLAAWGGQQFRLYHIADETAEPVMIVDGNYDDYGVRVGDALGVYGMGDAITVFTSGGGADRIVTFATTDGETWTQGADILLPEASAARLAISPVDADHLFINGPGVAPRYINADGDVLEAFDTAVIPSGTSISYFEVPLMDESVRKFVAIGNGWSSGTAVVELLGADIATLADTHNLLAAPTEDYAVNANLNATMQVAYDTHNHALVELVTNNGISSYSMYVVEPNPVTDGLPEAIVSTDALVFGEVAVNGAEVQTFTIVNTGEADLVINSVGYDSLLTAFDTELETGTVVEAGGEDTLVVGVKFAPFEAGEFVDNLILETNAGTITVALSGEGYILWPLEWRMLAEDAPWFYQAGVFQDMVRSMAFNKATGHLLVVSRIGGSYIYVLDAATGDSLGTVSTAGVSGGTYHINQVAVTDDGQIFVCGLAAWGGQQFRLYHIADETAEPVMIVDGNFDDYGIRVGDALGVYGTGDEITVYTSGSAAEKIVTFETTDGSTWVQGDDIPLPEASAARYGISPVDADHLFVNGPGVAPRYINSDGDVIQEFDTAMIPSGTNISYFFVNLENATQRHFVGIPNGWSSGTTVIELMGEDVATLADGFEVLAAPTDDYAINANLNATAQVAYNSHANALVELITNNGISSYSMDIVEPNAVLDTVVVSTEPMVALPTEYALGQNYPNPFNPSTTINLALPEAGEVHLVVYNLRGQEVMQLVNGEMEAGYHKVQFNASHLASGVYMYRVVAGDFSAVRKMLLVK